MAAPAGSAGPGARGAAGRGAGRGGTSGTRTNDPFSGQGAHSGVLVGGGARLLVGRL